MIKHARRGWLKGLVRGRRSSPIRNRSTARLKLERCEVRDCPSSSIPLNGFTWTPIGPSPIADGQSSLMPPSTGRLNGVAFDAPLRVGQTYPFPVDSNTIYVASDTGGIWRTNDGGHTWLPETDFRGGTTLAIAEVNRGVNDTVYGVEFLPTGLSLLERSTDGGRSFVKTSPFPALTVVTKLVVVPINPLNQAQDLIYASLSDPFTATGQGIYRSTDGGSTWTRITNIGSAPFSTSSFEFTDVAVDPTNPDVVYAAIGNELGDGFNGVYRTDNARSASPSWRLLIGGSAFVPGSTPGNVKIAVSPVLPSVLFASVALRDDPGGGGSPLLGVFRSVDSGVNWTPTLIANTVNQTTDPQNYLGISGPDNNVIVVSPFSPANPMQQIVYVAGFGGPVGGPGINVMVSTNSTTTLTGIGIGSDGVGPYPNVHQGQLDQLGRFVIATGGGIYRDETSTAPSLWVSLNGDIGPQGLAVSQFHGFALHPLSPDLAVGNITSVPTLLQNAVRFSDPNNFANPNLAYGWHTIDSNGIDGNYGEGAVIYNPFNPSIVYRVVAGGSGFTAIRRSNDGGLTWTGVGNGFPAVPDPPAFVSIGASPGLRFVPPLAIDPSRPNRLYSGYNSVFATDSNGDQWRQSIQTTLSGGTIAIPDLPTTMITRMGGGPIGIDALATGRQSNVALAGTSILFNGASIFAATETDALFDPMSGNYMDAAIGGPQLMVAVIPDLSPAAWPPPMTNYNNHYWAHITPPGLTGNITQIINDPSGPGTLYVYTNSGQVFRGTNLTIGLALDMNMNIIPDPSVTSITWTDISSNLPASFIPVDFPQPMALDKNIVRVGTALADRLYVGTNNGVFALDNPTQDFSGSPPNWREVGLKPSDGSRTLPNASVSTVALNPTTGILAAATYGRGVYEMQIRGLIRGQVFEDLNGNGSRDVGEPPFANVTVQILDLDNNLAQIASVATDANGFYEFRSLRAGNYRLEATGPGNLFQTTLPPPDFLNFTEQSTFDGPNQVNFGLFRAGAISGIKFEDRNGNGFADAGEPPLSGFTIFIDRNNNGTLDVGEPSTVTAADGSYTFDATNVQNGPNNPTGVGPDVIRGNPDDPFSGPHQIREVQQVGFIGTNPPPGGALSVSLTSGEQRFGVDLGNIRISRITGSKFEDRNGNGIRDAGEGPLAGFNFDLIDANTGAVLRTVASDANGHWEFLSLGPGTYRIREEPTAGFTQTTANPPDFVLTATSQLDDAAAFGNFRNITFTGVKFNDVNGNGVRDPGEPGLQNFTFRLTNSITGAVLATAVSDASGAFTFADRGPLPGGARYRIREVVPAGWFQTTPNPADSPAISGQNASVAFGNFRGVAVSGTVYNDLNGNGVRDPGEPGVLGFTVQLLRNGTIVATGTTASDGTYAIPVVGPGTYQLVLKPRHGFVVTAPVNGYSFVTVSGADVTGQDFGVSRRGFTVTSNDSGGLPLVIVRDASTNAIRSQFMAYSPGFSGGVRVATGYINNDSIPDIITGAGPTGGPHVKVFDGATGNVLFQFMAYETTFTGGIYVAAGDIDGDGRDEIITGTGNGGGPFVKVFSGVDGHLIKGFFPYSTGFRGGVTVAAGDMNGDGIADIMTGAGPGGGPHVEVFSGNNLTLLRSFFPYDTAFTGGVFVAMGDVNGDGRADLITGPGIGGGPHIKVYSGATGTQLYSFLAYPTTSPGFPWASGAHVAAYDVNLDGLADIVVGPGRGQGPRVKAFSGGTLATLFDFLATDPTFLGGIFVGGA